MAYKSIHAAKPDQDIGMRRLHELTLAYIDAIRYHGATMQANARVDLIQHIYEEADGDYESRKILLRWVEQALSNEFEKDLDIAS